VLLEHEADVLTSDKVQWLWRAAFVDSLCQQDGISPLMLACCGDNVEIVRLIILAGAKVNGQDEVRLSLFAC
jgi:ankyrin repeat protein